MMSPGSLEAAGLISQAEYLKVAALTQSASPDAHKKLAGKINQYMFFFVNIGNNSFDVEMVINSPVYLLFKIYRLELTKKFKI